MFENLGRVLVNYRKAAVALFVIGILVAGAVGSLIFSRLDSGGYSDPNSDSYKVYEYLRDDLKVEDPAVVVVIDAGDRDVTEPAVAQQALALEAMMAQEEGVTRTLSFWGAGADINLKSADGKAAYVLIFGQGEAFSPASEDLGKLFQDKYDGEFSGLRLYAGGVAVVGHAITKKISDDLKIAEAISIPLTFILLAFVFGALAASAMPLIVGVSAIVGAFFILWLISLFTAVSVYSLNLTTGMGLGLGIDYALLMVNRFREELNKGKSVDDSVITTMATAGKTVFYSGLTVLVTMVSLTFFPLPFLKSFGYAGVSVVALAVVGAIFGLPPILAMMGKRINKGPVRKSAMNPKDDGRWADTARFVMRRPVPVVLLSLIALGIMAAPLQNISFSQGDSRMLPASNPAAIATALQTERFPGQTGTPIEIITFDGANNVDALNDYANRISQVPGIVGVVPPQVIGEDVRIVAYQSMLPRTPESQKLIHDLRDVKAPTGTLIGGVAADYTDSQDGISRTLPWAFGWIAISVLLLVFVFTGSIILPIKAVLLNVLSLAATMGVLTWVFIDGNLQWLVGSFTVTGSLDTSIVILIAVVVFGLSMDYELFLLSRIREEHLEGRSNVESVATGLQRSARIITAAAVLLAVVFAAFVTSGVTSIKTMGFGVALAVLLDATLIRALLVPALMRLMGERNWWAPKAMQRFTLKH
jgi:putative drug exporter of the RND superfamily|uniref:MMPL family transporter n=1 Tax=Candidatus Planktophila sp. TaxID=2175601 RepID=UPI0040499D18